MLMFEYFPGQGGEPGEHFHRVAGGRLRLRVNKRTHKIRFENETEDMVDVVIEDRKQAGKVEERTGLSVLRLRSVGEQIISQEVQ